MTLFMSTKSVIASWTLYLKTKIFYYYFGEILGMSSILVMGLKQNWSQNSDI